MILDQLRPREFKGGYATTYGACMAAPIGVLCLVVYMVDLRECGATANGMANGIESCEGAIVMMRYILVAIYLGSMHKRFRARSEFS